MLTLFDSKNFYETGEGADKLRGKLTLLGKTRDTVVRDWKSTEGLGSKLAGFFTSQGSKDAQAQIDSDVAALKELQKLYDNTKIKKDFDQKDAIAATLSSASKAARNYAETTGAANLNIGEFANSQAKATASSLGLQLATSALNSALTMGLSFALEAAVAGIVHLVQMQEEQRRAALEAGEAFERQSGDVDAYISRVTELRTALDNGSLSQNEAYEARKELLSIQNEIIGQYGKETGAIDLLNGSLDAQTEKLKNISTATAEQNLTANASAYDKAARKMEEEKSYYLGTVYKDDAMDQLLAEFDGLVEADSNDDGTVNLRVNANARDAERIISEFAARARELLAPDTGNAVTIKGYAEDTLGSVQKIIEKYGSLYDDFNLYRILTDKADADDPTDVAYGDLMNGLLSAQKEYEEAVARGDQEAVERSLANLQAAKEKIAQADENGHLEEGVREYLDGIADAIDDETAADRFKINFKANTDDLQDAMQTLEGLDADAILALNSGEGAQEQKKAYEDLAAAAEEYGVSIDDLIGWLVDMGEVEGRVSEKMQAFTPNFDAFENSLGVIGQYQDSLQQLEAAQEQFNDIGHLTADTLKALSDNDLLQYLDFSSGSMQVNTDALLDNAEAAKVAAIEKLKDAAAADLQLLAEGRISEMSPIAQAALQNIGEANAIAGEKSAQAAAGYFTSSAGIAAMIDTATGGNGATEKFTAQAEAVLSAYGGFAENISKIDISAASHNRAAAGADAYTESLKREKEALEAEKEALEASKSALEDKKAVYESALRAVNKALDGEIDRLQELGKAEKEALEGQLDDLERAHDAAVKIIDDQIKKLEDQQQAWDDYYQPMIDAIQEQIDALEKKNDEEERALKLQKAQDAYERARTQKTVRLYTHDQGFIWAADEDAVQDAQSELDQARRDKEAADLAGQKQLLEDALEREKEKLQESISSYEAYKEKWEEITSEYADAQNKQILIALFGKEIEQQIIDQKGAAYEEFRDRYLLVQEQLTNVEAEIAANEERITQLEAIKQAWSDAADAYESEQDRLHAAQLLGAGWEKEILDGRLETLATFKTGYYQLQQDIAKIAEQIAAVTEKIAQKAAEAEAAAQRVANAGGAASTSATEIPPKYTIYNLAGRPISSANSREEAEKITSLGNKYYVQNYARGTLSAPGGLANVDEELGTKHFPELVVRPRQGHYTILDPGDGVVPADISRTLFRAAVDPTGFIAAQMSALFSRGQAPALSGAQGGEIRVSIGDIHLSGVQNESDLASAIVQRLPNVLLQKIRRR